MVFSSIYFLFFFLVLFFICYFIAPKKYKNIILLIFSLIFYAWGEPIYILIMIFSSLADYYNGMGMLKNDKDPKKRKKYLIISIVVNLGLLFFFKYIDFFIGVINSIFNLSINKLNIPLPIGISFFTFQTMSYSIDVYRRKINVEHSLLDFMTYVSMFPQLIAGPIVRYDVISKELHDRDVTFSKFSEGLLRFLRGLFKKVLIANNVGLLFNTILGIKDMSFMLSWLGALAYTLQIYFDFSGYSDMAIGIGKMIGFTYPENFNYPYISKSITEFWRRWHITLSSFFKDYVYIPLGGNRKHHILNILIVWILTGFWHGANYNFIISGLYYGVILLLEKYVLKHIKCNDTIKHIYTLFIIMIGWVIFSIDDSTKLLEYLRSMFLIGAPFINKYFLYYFKNYFLILVIGILFSTPIINKIQKIEEKLNKKYLVLLRIFIYLVLFIITISYLVNDSYNPFLYFRF
jgi:alginate O-acetyltransferase complex protein AlgI